MRFFDLRHFCTTSFEKYRCCQNQDSCINKKRQVQGNRTVYKIQFQSSPDAPVGSFDFSCLYQCRMQV